MTPTIQYLSFSISITIISWIVGLISNELIKNKSFYINISNFNFINNEKVNKIIGLQYIKWIVKNTFFKYFNQKIKLKGKIEISQLKEIRKEMTIAEIGHLIGFVFVTVFAVVKLANQNYLFALIMMLFNIILNLYPSLLQQQNKRRIDQMIKKYNNDTTLINT